MLQKQYSIDHLQPNSTYLVKVWANNKLGSGFPTIVEMVTKNDPQEIGNLQYYSCISIK